MKYEGRGIARFAQLFLVSLILHLAVIMVVTVAGKRDNVRHQLSPNMVVEFQENVKQSEERPDTEMKRHVMPLLPKRAVTHSAGTTLKPSFGPIPGTGNQVQQSPALHDVPLTSSVVLEKKSGSSIENNIKNQQSVASPGSVADRQGTAGAGLAQRTGDSASTASAASLQRRDNYQAQLKLLIEAHKEYPLAARRSGREGSCQRRFILGRNGTLKGVEAISSCGNAFLDEAATRAITTVGIFPPLPDDFKGAEEAFTIAMIFTLAR